ncbi:hypothetical protein O181_050312 [Austropuccinia psidii MF-1]|uniref:Reverse transcriptase Ty1/copia-type domain-containing protein n=1 Tax=Austropuccinia psidii MF-1 TaxID=1389203 RepID=A0A9Q3HNG7_9BASI|nr:hypothetical protein [Austropuccinia psidii MF-1]
MTNEHYSDAMRFLDIDSGKIVISRDFTIPSTFRSCTAHKRTEILPREVMSPQHQCVNLTLPELPNSSNSNSDSTIITPSRSNPKPTARNQGSQMKGWDYVPHYDTAPKNISSSIYRQNIIEHSRRMTRRSNQALLTNTVPYSKAIGDTQEKEKWHDAMKTKFNSLMQHNTRNLVAYPTDGSKVIGGIWRLRKNRNEFGEVYCYKARWVVLGNHQVHMLHYFYTWS